LTRAHEIERLLVLSGQIGFQSGDNTIKNNVITGSLAPHI